MPFLQFWFYLIWDSNNKSRFSEPLKVWMWKGQNSKGFTIDAILQWERSIWNKNKNSEPFCFRTLERLLWLVVRACRRRGVDVRGTGIGRGTRPDRASTLTWISWGPVVGNLLKRFKRFWAVLNTIKNGGKKRVKLEKMLFYKATFRGRAFNKTPSLLNLVLRLTNKSFIQVQASTTCYV